MRSQACLAGVADLKRLQRRVRNPFPFECWSALDTRIDVLCDVLQESLLTQSREMSKEETQDKPHTED